MAEAVEEHKTAPVDNQAPPAEQAGGAVASTPAVGSGTDGAYGGVAGGIRFGFTTDTRLVLTLMFSLTRKPIQSGIEGKPARGETPVDLGAQDATTKVVQDPPVYAGNPPRASMTAITTPVERNDSQQDAGGRAGEFETGGDDLEKALDSVQAEILDSRQEIYRGGAGSEVMEIIPTEAEENPAYAALQRELVNSPAMEARGGYIFANQGYDTEEDARLIDLCEALSRADSIADTAAQEEAHASAEATVPLIRPSSPAAAEARAVQQTLEDASEALRLVAEGAASAVGAAGPAGPELAPQAAEAEPGNPLFAEAIDREAVADDSRDTEKSVTDQEQRYANCIAALKDLKAELDALNTTNQKVESEHSARLEEKRQDTLLKAQEFIQFKRQVALAAENSRTGKPLQPKQVEQLEANEARKEAEVVVVRLENIKLRNRLRRHEQLLRQKEELAEGLHLIDFEQLKIENTTYNEKIEERNEELLKLRKKITNIVQVLTHVKEKLQFVQGEVVQFRDHLKVIDADVAKMRDTLPQTKQERDRLRNENVALKQRNGLLGNDALLRDYEFRVVSGPARCARLCVHILGCRFGEIVDFFTWVFFWAFQDDAVVLNARIDQYRAHHAELSAEALAIKRNIQKALQSQLSAMVATLKI
ncbi:MAG: hypothetical protein BJ554DRAFT_4626 [Olpidium bornovanus]|uniref:CCDC113/CCDC96 coiled-coil domain-containing protein n=1 Tax=Olpidium bornovanus TaxID=278681 RepID=A0A8H7ZMQ9_9FUNG|nr:MAG: hypothetical protein BJ554DRAFT_4626 [Olpidium bornovanus]